MVKREEREKKEKKGLAKRGKVGYNIAPLERVQAPDSDGSPVLKRLRQKAFFFCPGRKPRGKKKKKKVLKRC